MALDRDTTFTWNGHSCFEIRSPGQGSRPGPVPSEPEQPEERRPGRGVRRDARDPRPLRPHGRCRGDRRRHRPAWPCIHEMSLWLGRRLPGGMDAAAIGMNKGGRWRSPGSRSRWSTPTTRPATGTRPRDRAVPRRPDRVHPRIRERVPGLCRRRHRRVRRHALHPRAVCAGAGAAADRRSLHDGAARGLRSRPSCSACSTSSRSTTGRSRS